MFINNICASLHLWWKKNQVNKSQDIMKMTVEGPSSIPVWSRYPFFVLQNYCSEAEVAWNFVILVEYSDTGCPSLIGIRLEYLFAYQFWYWELWVGNVWGGERKHYFVNFFMQGYFQWRWVRICAAGFIYQSAVTNSMHLHSTYTPHLQYF